LFFGIVIGLSQAGRSWNPYQFVSKFGWQFLAIIALAIVFFLPFILNYATGYASVELWKGVRTTFSEYLTVHGIFLFIAATFFAVVLFTNYLRGNAPQRSGFELSGWAIYLLPLLTIAEILLMANKFYVLALVVPLIGVAIWIGLHHKTTIEVRWVAVLMLVSLLLTVLVEYVVLKGDIGRLNTVFKFYLQAWVIFGVAGAAGLGLIIEHLVFTHRKEPVSNAPTRLNNQNELIAAPPPGIPLASIMGIVRWIWWGSFSILILAGLLYPLAAARAKMNDRYVEKSPSGLNGMDYMRKATYGENNQILILRWDYEAIQWIRQNIKGSPVIMEGNVGLYHWGNRYSIYTGLPTLIGWDWHTKQQYSLIPGDIVDYRLALVRDFYNKTDQTQAIETAHRYGISYVIVGGLERAIYDANGLAKFEQANDLWRLVYQNEQVKIYQVH
jgi:uncharacterized membrane protein